jgi:hypothetical protein
MQTWIMTNNPRPSMRIDLAQSGTPAGVTNHATPEGATLSVWAGNREMIAHLDPQRLAEAAQIFADRHGHMQIVGTVREFIAPPIA